MIPNEHIVCLVPSNEFEGIWYRKRNQLWIPYHLGLITYPTDAWFNIILHPRYNTNISLENCECGIVIEVIPQLIQIIVHKITEVICKCINRKSWSLCQTIKRVKIIESRQDHCILNPISCFEKICKGIDKIKITIRCHPFINDCIYL